MLLFISTHPNKNEGKCSEFLSLVFYSNAQIFNLRIYSSSVSFQFLSDLKIRCIVMLIFQEESEPAEPGLERWWDTPYFL